MSIIDDTEALEKEIRELILNSKAKRCTIFEPCNRDNLSKYLKSIQEEMNLYGVNYLFNQYKDLDSENLTDSMVRMANATWGLLLQHKQVTNSEQKLKERNYSLQQNNFFLNNMVEKQKQKLSSLDSKLRSSDEEKRQLILKVDKSNKNVANAESTARRVKSQLSSREQELTTRLRKAEKENENIRDKFGAGIYTSRSDIRSSQLEEYRAREKKYKESIAKLQENNRQLIQEVISLKEELLEEASGSLSDG